jgi:hypothetical protein
VIRQLAGHYGFEPGNDGLLSEIGPFSDPPPVFEFLAVSEGVDERVLVHEPSGAAFESLWQLVVFHEGWTAAVDAGETES